MIERQNFNRKLDCFRQISIKLRVAFDKRSWRLPSLSRVTIIFVFLGLLFIGVFLVAKRRFVNNDPWVGLAEIGPASSPSAWQNSKPEILLMAYPGWSGIFSAAQAQGPVLGTPLDFSIRIQQSLVNLIKKTPSLRIVVIHGIPPGSISFARKLRLQIPSIRIFFVYHGTTSQPFHAEESGLIVDMIQAEKDGVINSIGVVKVGLESSMRMIGGTSVVTLPNFPLASLVLPSSKYSSRDGRIHIGVFVALKDQYHKNTITQLLAACLVKGAIVHVTIVPNIVYLKNNCEIVETGVFHHSRFLFEMSRMDIIMYVTLTEAYPMMLLESSSLGIPVIVSRTHHVFDVDPVLSSMLVVSENDNPDEISKKISVAIANIDDLRKCLLNLVICLHKRAEFAWKTALDRIIAYEKNPFVEGQVIADVPVCSPPSPQPKVQTDIDTSSIELRQSARGRIAFVTYELESVVLGGAGVVISNLVEDLLENGQSVTVLAHMQLSQLKNWIKIMEEKGWSVGPHEQLTVHHIPSLVGEDAPQSCYPRNLFLRRSAIFALAAQAAYNLDPFDAIEFFDYVGAGFELTRRLYEWKRANLKGEWAPEPYLPEHVPILIRLHGTLQLIHQSEDILIENSKETSPQPCLLSNNERSMWPLMYMMERYTLLAAHLVLPQSMAMMNEYSQAYNIDPSRLILAPPPMTRITSLFKNKRDPTILSHGPASSDMTLRGPGVKSKSQLEIKILVYGRIMRVKGSETVAASAALLQRHLWPGISVRFVFAGADWECSVHSRATSQCVKKILPRDFPVTFLGAIDHSGLLNLLPTVHGAIFASTFETFGMAPHEIAATGLPIIVSDIAAYSEFFSEQNSYLFSVDNATSLADATLLLVRDLFSHKPRRAEFKYAEAAPVYERVIYGVKSDGGIPAPDIDLRLLESAIEPLEAECWPSSECQH